MDNNEFQAQPEQYGNQWDFVPPTPKKKKGITGGKLVAVALCSALLGGLLAGSAVLLGNKYLDDAITAPGNTVTMLEGQRDSITINTVNTGKLMTPAEVYAANVNSTVGITTSTTTNFWGYQTTSAASGSGFILTENGYVLTNYHVVKGSDAITVALYNGASYEATLVGFDESNDIAVLKVEAEGLTPVILGDSDKMNVGDSVVAIGNPLGELTFSLTAGTISAMDREITMSTGVTMKLTQTDCAINSGNSGGALFNLYGEVVGVTNAKYSSSSSSEASIDNIGFAIPMNDIRNIVDSIIEKGYVAKPYIGVSVLDVSEETQSYGLPAGAAVRSVTEDGPAKVAGLQANDIITGVNGVEIKGVSDLTDAISAASVGDELKLQVYRKGETLELTVTVGEKIQSATEQDSAQSGGQFVNPFGSFGN